jgi:hypothetical protein
MTDVQKPVDSYKGLPRRITVGAFTFRVHIEPETHPELVDAFGCCNTNKQLIYLREGQDAALALNTVVHELSHAVNWVYGVEDDSTEEQFTGSHTNGMIDMWMRNPRLFLWIAKLLRQAKKDASHD